MVVLDSDHSKMHVLAELDAFGEACVAGFLLHCGGHAPKRSSSADNVRSWPDGG